MEIIEDSPIIQRLKTYIEYVGLSTTQFADKASIPRPTFSQLLRGRNKTINNQILGKLNDGFPELNIMWLLFGQGEMRVSANIETSGAQNSSPSGNLATQLAAQQAVDTNNKPKYDLTPNVANGVQSSLFDENNTDAVFNDEKFGAFREAVSKKSAGNEKKKISSIVVFYTDNSFQTYVPET